MPIFITQGRYTRDAVKGMLARPEDRADQVSRLLSKIGGRLIGYYVTFGEYDFLAIAEAPSEPIGQVPAPEPSVARKRRL